MKWMISEDRLGSDQREVIDEVGKISTKPIWIQGYAGSGKSVLLLHSLKDYLAQKPTSKVCVVVFTRALVDLIKIGITQIPFLEGKVIPVFTIYEFRNHLTNKFDAIFCDEIQDLPLDFIKQMRSACNHLVIAGDSVQSIYATVPEFNTSPANPSEILAAIQPIEKKLKVIYRLTTSVISVLKNVFSEMLAERPVIGAVDTEIKLFNSKSEKEEISYVWFDAKETNELRTSEIIAILLYGRKPIIEFVNCVLELEKKPLWTPVNNSFGSPDFGKMNSHLAMNNIPLMLEGNRYGSLNDAANQNKIVLMTYHSSKGLDFDYVYLPLVGNEMWLHSSVPINALLLVALSRSKSGLTITYSGEMYKNFRPFLKTITARPIPEIGLESDEVIF